MSPRTPDRFDRIAEKALKQSADKQFFAPAEAAKLMRDEHRWVRNMVRAEQKKHISHMDEWIVLQDIMAKLQARAK
jgi:hypothetical protein